MASLYPSLYSLFFRTHTLIVCTLRRKHPILSSFTLAVSTIACSFLCPGVVVKLIRQRRTTIHGL